MGIKVCVLICLSILVGCSTQTPLWEGFPRFENLERTPEYREQLSDSYAKIARQMKHLVQKNQKNTSVAIHAEDSIQIQEDNTAQMERLQQIGYSKERIKNIRLAALKNYLHLRNPSYCHPLTTDYSQLEKIPGGTPVIVYPRIVSPALIESVKEENRHIWYIPVTLQLPNDKKYQNPQELKQDFDFWLEEKLPRMNTRQSLAQIPLALENISFSFTIREKNTEKKISSFSRHTFDASFFNSSPTFERPLWEKIADTVTLFPTLVNGITARSQNKYAYYSCVLRTPENLGQKDIPRFWNLVVTAKNGEDSHNYANFVYDSLEHFEQNKAIDKLQLHPVCLEKSGREDQSFSFIVAADFQYHDKQIHLTKRFLDSLEHPHLLPVSKKLVQRVKEARFVIVIGDLVDGEGFSSNAFLRAAGIAMGYTSATSPYPKEYENLLNKLAGVSKPLFAIPGNHDHYAWTGGLFPGIVGLENINVKPPFGRYIGKSISSTAYTLAGLPFAAVPSMVDGEIGKNFFRNYAKKVYGGNYLYDGSNLWRKLLGPEEFCFTYRGHTFAGINSYQLTRRERHGAGPFVKQFGGGVKFDTVVWLETLLKYHRTVNKSQFVFMHQDPRGTNPEVKVFDKAPIGTYHGVGNNMIGEIGSYLGINSTQDGTWLPVITPGATWLANYMSDPLHQEWMHKRSLLNPFNGSWFLQDPNCYNARPLLEALVAGAWNAHNRSGVSHIFLGHNDHPNNHENRAPVNKKKHKISGTFKEGQSVIPDESSRPDSSILDISLGRKALNLALGPALKNPPQPQWHHGDSVKLRKRRSLSFIRVDDVGQNDIFTDGSRAHGFSLVVVNPAHKTKPVTVHYIALPK